MNDDVPHRIDKIHKVGACLVIPVTTWVVNPVMLNGIGYVRLSGKYICANSSSPNSAEIRYAVSLGLGPLVI